MLQFMLKTTKCETCGEFMNLDRHGNEPGVDMRNSSQDLVLDLKDARNQRNLKSLMTPISRTTIREDSHEWT